MNLPSLVNFMMRALPNVFGWWPSETKTSPFGAMATPVGRSNRSLLLPATPCRPSIISTLPVWSRLSTSWPRITPPAFFADMPSTVSWSLTSLAQMLSSASMVKPCG